MHVFILFCIIIIMDVVVDFVDIGANVQLRLIVSNFQLYSINIGVQLYSTSNFIYPP
jgi:hypothetical protein